MINEKKITVVMPAYNAERTLRETYQALPHDLVDDVILVDDGSRDDTVMLSRSLGIHTIQHEKNRGYGGNQKTCYRAALERGADVVIMVHPDYQYDPRLVTPLASMIVAGTYDVVLASRIIGKGALRGGMPLYKYFFNRVLTLLQNILMNQKLSEYHTGYRAFSAEVLRALPLERNSEDFVFDNQMLTQICFKNFRIGEISCPTHYFPEASSINFSRSLKYGLGCLWNGMLFLFARLRLYHPEFLEV